MSHIAPRSETEITVLMKAIKTICLLYAFFKYIFLEFLPGTFGLTLLDPVTILEILQEDTDDT